MTRSSSRRAVPTQPRRFPNALHGSPNLSADETRGWTILGLVAIGAFGLALLVFALGPHRIGDYFTETDFYGAYADGARLIQHGRLVPARYGVVGPVYEIALALVGLVVRNLFLAGELLSIAASVATVWLWFQIVRRRLDARTATFTALFVIANGFFFRFGYSVTTDALAIALQSACLALLLSPGGAPAPAGVLAALAFLTRYNAIALLPAGLIAILAGGTEAKARGRAALAFTIGFGVPVVPWVLFSLAHGGALHFQLHHNIAYEVFARSKGIAWDDYQRDLQAQFPTLWSVIARDPGAVFGRMASNVFEHLGQDAAQLLGWPVALAAFVGLVLGARGGQLRRVWPVLVAAALIFLTLVPVFYAERYSLALLPAYALLAALAFATPFAAVPIGAGRKTWLKPFLAVVPLGLSLAASVRLQARVIDQLPVEVLECAETLRAARAPGDRVIARKGHIAYHGGVEAVGFPFVNGLDTLASYARQAKARWLYFSWPEAETRPQFTYLLDTSAVVPGLTPRRVTEPHPAVLYEIGPDFGRVPAWLSNDTLRAWHDTYAALLIDGTDAKLLARLGAISYQLGRLTQARDALYQAAKLAPDRPEVFLLLGRTLIELGDAHAAEAAFERAEILDPTSAEARIGHGLAADIQGRPAEAAQLWRPVIADTPNPRILERMVELYQSLGDAAAAEEARRALSRVRGDAGGKP